jgi:hypothetical protein
MSEVSLSVAERIFIKHGIQVSQIFFSLGQQQVWVLWYEFSKLQ